MEFKHYSSIFFMILLASCQEQTKKNEVIAPRQVDPAKGRALFEAFNAHNWNAMADKYDADALFMDPALGVYPVHQSKDSIVAKYTQLQAMCPDINDSLVAVWPCDSNKLVAEFVSKGTLPDGSILRLPIVSILTYRNGLIISDHTYYDNFE
ncbi:MAG: hypothetical protein RLZZ262_496 [Bacteroidota bacterium]